MFRTQVKGEAAITCGEEGSVIVETAIVIPLLLLLAFGLIEFFEYGRAQLALNQIMHKAALTTEALKLPALGALSTETQTVALGKTRHTAEETDYTSCLENGIPAGQATIQASCAHKVLRFRIQRMLEAIDFADSIASATVTTQFDPTTRRVKIQVSTTNRRLTLPAKTFTVTVRRESGY